MSTDASFLKRLGIRQDALPSPEPQLAESITVPKDAWDRALAAYMAANDDGYVERVFSVVAECEKLTRRNRSMRRALLFAAAWAAGLTVAFVVMFVKGGS